MFKRGTSAVRLIGFVLLLRGLPCAGGCGAATDGAEVPGAAPGAEAASSSAFAGDAAHWVPGYYDLEPNDAFDLAVVGSDPGRSVRAIEGRIDAESDVDVFDLGRLEPGDRIFIDRVREDSQLRVCLALFDARHDVVLVATDPYPEGGPAVLEMAAAPIVRAERNYYLAVTHDDEQIDLGTYRLDIRIEKEEQRIVEAPQRVFLDFEGAVLTEPIFGVSEVAPFSAGRIAPEYAGRDEAVKQAILDTLTDNFHAFDIQFVTTGRMDDCDAGPTTVIYFGSSHARLLGASNGVDEFNRDRCDDAIIFAERFGPEMFGFVPSVEELGRAMGNVAAHELGHLLGLYHVEGAQAIMNQTAGARDLIIEQRFSTAPLSAAVFPIGMQDAGLSLAETVGRR